RQTERDSMLIAFGIGPLELVVIFVVFLLMVGVPILVVVAVVMLARRAAGGGSKPPLPAGPPSVVQRFSPSDASISAGARWLDNELEVTAAEAGTHRLFEVALSGIEQAMLTYRFRIRTENLQGAVYPEMWCRIVGMGEFFSRGLDQKVRGANNWTSVEIPFYLKRGQRADLLKLNLVFEGTGLVRLADIEVLATPLAG
ncbi:MAG: hypothetical protein ACREHD_14350, partial [Pirellulales bacterium]